MSLMIGWTGVVVNDVDHDIEQCCQWLVLIDIRDCNGSADTCFRRFIIYSSRDKSPHISFLFDDLLHLECHLQRAGIASISKQCVLCL